MPKFKNLAGLLAVGAALTSGAVALGATTATSASATVVQAGGWGGGWGGGGWGGRNGRNRNWNRNHNRNHQRQQGQQRQQQRQRQNVINNIRVRVPREQREFRDERRDEFDPRDNRTAFRDDLFPGGQNGFLTPAQFADQLAVSAARGGDATNAGDGEAKGGRAESDKANNAVTQDQDVPGRR
ncbi:hypothetical protein [Microtetraspora malaysiensis]|uniref:hypothetical protein n=1 Tax=Microtetraspora malaysiensis TaxID=161358 RepID=UPI003D8C678B